MPQQIDIALTQNLEELSAITKVITVYIETLHQEDEALITVMIGLRHKIDAAIALNDKRSKAAN